MNIGASIGEFNAECENVQSYEERVECFFIANDITDEKKKLANVLTAIGPKTYKLVRNLLTTISPLKSTLENVWGVLKKHFNPVPSEIIERYKFNTYVRQEGQSVASYIAELRKMSEFCKFADLDEQIRDRIVCGIHNTRIQRLLLAKTKLDLQTAIDISIGAELTDEQLTTLEHHDTEKVYAMEMDRKQWSPRPEHNKKEFTTCKVCGKRNHKSEDCRLKNASCYRCGKKGHIKPMCLEKAPRIEKNRNHPKTTYNVEEDTDSEPEVYTMYNIVKEDSGCITSTVKINGTICKFQIDTGAAVSIMSEMTFKQLWVKAKRPKLQWSDIRLKSFTGELIKVLGKIDVKIEQKRMKIYIVPGQVPNIAGRDMISSL